MIFISTLSLHNPYKNEYKVNQFSLILGNENAPKSISCFLVLGFSNMSMFECSSVKQIAITVKPDNAVLRQVIYYLLH